jgi:hypothetical protein
MKMNRISGILAGAAALPFLVAGGIALAAPIQTGQGIMVNLHANGTFAITQTDTYQYNEATAATYFTNAWDQVVPSGTPPQHFSSSSSTATVLSSTLPATDPACTPPAPSAPVAPAPDSNKLNGLGQSDVVGNNKCNFLGACRREN